MLLQVLRGKLHALRITGKVKEYMGSLGIDSQLLELAGIYPGERVEVYNIDNGARFSTYILREERGSRRVVLYGAAARMGEIGDRIIVVSYGYLNEAELKDHRVKILILREDNSLERLEELKIEDLKGHD